MWVCVFKRFCSTVERFWSNLEWRSCCNLYVGMSIPESCFISERFWSSWAWRFCGNLVCGYVGMCIQMIPLHSWEILEPLRVKDLGQSVMWVGDLKNSASESSDVSSCSNSRRECCEASGFWFQQICKVTSALWWLSGVRYRSNDRHRETINISIRGATSERDAIGSLVAGGIRSVSYNGVCMSVLPEGIWRWVRRAIEFVVGSRGEFWGTFRRACASLRTPSWSKLSGE